MRDSRCDLITRARREFDDVWYVLRCPPTQLLAGRRRDGRHAADRALMLIDRAARVDVRLFVKRLAVGRDMEGQYGANKPELA
ncbi:hypothetical protein PTKU46_82550 [Paraburkholderia terrae]